MLGVDEIGMIRRAHFREGRSVKGISQDLGVSRATFSRIRQGANSHCRRRLPSINAIASLVGKHGAAQFLRRARNVLDLQQYGTKNAKRKFLY